MLIASIQQEPGDWDEHEYANYIEAELLDITGEFIRASWQSGFGAVPVGFTTYATNAIESTWRLVKQLFDKGYLCLSFRFWRSFLIRVNLAGA